MANHIECPQEPEAPPPKLTSQGLHCMALVSLDRHLDQLQVQSHCPGLAGSAKGSGSRKRKPVTAEMVQPVER